MRHLPILGLVLLAAPALAQQAPLDKLYACTSVTDSTPRLARFDEAAPSLTALAESAAVSTTPAASAAAKPTEKPKTLDNVTLAVKSGKKAPDGSYRFVMENGQVWRQTDSIRLPGLGKGPWTAEVRKAAMGAFMLKLGDRTAVRVRGLE